MSVGESLAGFRPELPWNSPKFRDKKDTEWTAGCRWLQSWWREQRGFQPGERTDISDTLVGDKFPVDTDAEHNFFGQQVINALEERVLNGAEYGVVATDVLFRHLLEPQVLIFNLLGEFWAQPNELLPWVQRLDDEATEVTELRLLWTPEPKRNYIGGGPGFDGFVEYRAASRRRFLAIECTYAESLATSKLTVNQRVIDATDVSPHWREGASRRLNRPHLRRLWVASLVAQTIVEVDKYDSGRIVSMACAANEEVALATNFVRADLRDPAASLVRSSLDDFMHALAPAHPEWAEYITTRYLDFDPVLKLLSKEDPRRGSFITIIPTDDLRRLVAIGQKVSGSRTAFKQMLKRLDNGDIDSSQVEALDARAGDLVADLEAFWEALAALED
jgi:PD-(D/E)XK nuclease superfamily protein